MKHTRMGLTIWSYTYHWRRAPNDKCFRVALQVLENCAQDLAAGAEAGATVFRALCLGGGRWENFPTLRELPDSLLAGDLTLVKEDQASETALPLTAEPLPMSGLGGTQALTSFVHVLRWLALKAMLPLTSTLTNETPNHHEP